MCANNALFSKKMSLFCNIRSFFSPIFNLLFHMGIISRIHCGRIKTFKQQINFQKTKKKKPRYYFQFFAAYENCLQLLNILMSIY